jgi:AcrR family transcriptional regulator
MSDVPDKRDVPDQRDNPKKLPKNRAVDKSEVILTGAMQEFMTSGYAAASMDRIAVSAGVSKPTLYSYFRDKAGLFTALIQQMAQDEQNIRLLKSDQLLQVPLRDSLKHIANTMLDKISEQHSIFALVRLILGESGRFPVLAKTFVRNTEKPRIEELSYLFANHPDFKAADPDVAARFFHGSIVYHVILQEILHGRDILPMERDRFIDGLIDLIVGERSSSSDNFANPAKSRD